MALVIAQSSLLCQSIFSFGENEKEVIIRMSKSLNRSYSPLALEPKSKTRESGNRVFTVLLIILYASLFSTYQIYEKVVVMLLLKNIPLAKVSDLCL